MHIVSAIKKNKAEAIVDCLLKLGEIISIMREQMLLLLSKCPLFAEENWPTSLNLEELDAKAFYVDMRPFLSG